MSMPLPNGGQPRTSMDELMLAMDVVDTLRHEQSLVARELASEDRDEAFVARIRQIYASQGIDVSDAVIRQGVEALKQDRFAYVPPRRSVAVRLAELWVDRWRWAKRSMIAGFVGTTAYALVAIPNAWQADRDYRAYRESVTAVQHDADAVQRRDAALAARVDAWASVPEQVTVPVAALRADIERGRAASAAMLAALVAIPTLAVDDFAADPDAARAALQSPQTARDQVSKQLDALEARAARAERLIADASHLTQLEARVAGLTMSEAAASTWTAQQTQARALLGAGDADAASVAVATLAASVDQLNLAYRLRIANRSGVQSGLWRYHDDSPNGRNYYLVVEAIGDDGRALMVPVLNEETQRIGTVSMFAVRVPESEYERVKADKLDNGLIDDADIGEKRRGELDVEYHIAVAGGAITEW